MSRDSPETEEEYLHCMLAIIRDAYAREASPYLKRLAHIAACKPPQPFFLSAAQFDALPESIKQGLLGSEQPPQYVVLDSPAPNPNNAHLHERHPT